MLEDLVAGFVNRRETMMLNLVQRLSMLSLRGI